MEFIAKYFSGKRAFLEKILLTNENRKNIENRTKRGKNRNKREVRCFQGRHIQRKVIHNEMWIMWINDRKVCTLSTTKKCRS